MNVFLPNCLAGECPEPGLCGHFEVHLLHQHPKNSGNIITSSYPAAVLQGALTELLWLGQSVHAWRRTLGRVLNVQHKSLYRDCPRVRRKRTFCYYYYCPQFHLQHVPSLLLDISPTCPSFYMLVLKQDSLGSKNRENMISFPTNQVYNLELFFQFSPLISTCCALSGSRVE